MSNNSLNMHDSDKPWYKEGLRFGCTECGKCCTGAPGFVWISEDEIAAMANNLDISPKLFKLKYTRKRENRYALTEKKSQNNSCVFLEGNKCVVYKSRPLQCRTFPWWKENLNTRESWENAAKDCEGISENAPLIPYSQIQLLERGN